MNTIKTTLFCLMGLTLSASIAMGADPVVANGKTVTMNYTLKVDGNVVDSSNGKEPLQYTQGQHMLIPGLEKQLAGLKAGDKKHIEVKSDEAYGPVNDKLFMEVPRSSLPPDLTPKVGMVLQMQSAGGRPMPGVITEVKDKTIVLNFNHPLAGKDLSFDVEIVNVQ